MESPVSNNLFQAWTVQQTDHGVQVVVCHEPQAHVCFISIGIGCGAMNTTARSPQGAEMAAPAGTAHFLEHLLLDGHQEGFFRRFMREGARCNGHTHHVSTVYTMLTHRFRPSLLREFLEHLFFMPISAKDVEKQRRIIYAELAEHLDRPGKQAVDCALNALFPNHWFSMDIVGTEKSIGEIDLSHLEMFRKTYYQAHGITVFVHGSADPDEVMAVLQAFPFSQESEGVGYQPPIQETPVVGSEVVDMASRQCNVLLGFSENRPASNSRAVENELRLTLFWEMMMGPGGQWKRELGEAGLVRKAGYQLDFVPGLGFSCLHVNTTSQLVVANWLTKRLEAVLTDLDPVYFEPARRRLAGRILGLFDYPEVMSDRLHWMFPLGWTPIRYYERLWELELEDVIAYAGHHLNGGRVTILS